jgi:trehalose 6-phosphate phosphatase
MQQQGIKIDLNKFDAVIFDMDGVITQSARVHAESWKRMFDDYLQKRAERQRQKFVPFDKEKDYYRYIDGKPRYDGTRSFLESRGISLPYGSPDDSPDKETICGLGNRKNQYFLKYLKEHGTESYPSTVDFIRKMEARNKRVAVISSSRNAKEVLEAAGVLSLFHVIVDGIESAKHGLKGKPEPDIFLDAAKRLNVVPGRAIVVEDAISGVKAGKAGGFGLVIGIDRSGRNPELKSSGADVVISDLSEIRSENDEYDADD